MVRVHSLRPRISKWSNELSVTWLAIFLCVAGQLARNIYFNEEFIRVSATSD